MLEINKSPSNHEPRTSAPALGDDAKHPECIFTPQGIPITGIIEESRDSNAEIMSLVVPSPPAYRIKSTSESINTDTNSDVSEGLVGPLDSWTKFTLPVWKFSGIHSLPILPILVYH